MRDPLERPVASVADVVLYLVGIAGIAAAITMLYLGMQPVMNIGGMCAEGGPYVIQHTCPKGVAEVTMLAFIMGTAAVFLALWKGSAVGHHATAAVFLAWPALFGVIGFNFLQNGLDPPGDDPGWAWGWLITGIVFETMAFGPLLGAIWLERWTSSPPTTPRVPTAARAAPGGPRLSAAIRDARAARDVKRSTVPPSISPGTTGSGGSAPGDPIEPAEPTGPAGDSLVDGLERLAALHEGGSLSDAEYSRAKAELLEREGA